MNEIIIESLSEYVEQVENLDKSSLCRGVSDKNHKLIPSLFRGQENEEHKVMEKNLMWVFKTNAKPHLKYLPSTEIEWLVIAQHHGLPTRLLDWSLSPLVACFFAVHSLSKEDGAIYIYNKRIFKKEEEIDPTSFKKIIAFFPSHASTRVTAQSGMFTIHPSKENTFDSDDIQKIIIPAKYKSKILESLVKFGIHDGTMFPGLDGICNYVKYQVFK